MTPDRLRATFGTSDLINDIYDRFGHALRFTLGGELPIEDPARHLKAMDRARALVRAFFPDALPEVLIFFLRDDASDNGVDAVTAKELALLRFDSAQLHHAFHQQDTLTGGPSGTIVHCFTCAITDAKDIDRLLWGMMASETPIRPRLTSAHLVLLYIGARRLMRVYDDRFIDVAAMDSASIEEISALFPSWIEPLGT